jgi:hypothetical protein
VKEVISNTTSFERLATADPAAELANGHGAPDQAPCVGAGGAPAGNGSNGVAKSGAPKPASHRLQVHPRFPYDAGHSHGCRLCPANLCKVRVLPSAAQAPVLPRSWCFLHCFLLQDNPCRLAVQCSKNACCFATFIVACDAHQASGRCPERMPAWSWLPA